jgi:hypothetical protein
MGSWSSEQIRSAVADTVMLTWAPGKARYVIQKKKSSVFYMQYSLCTDEF